MTLKLIVVLLAFSLGGCFSSDAKKAEKKSALGERDIAYYSNKSVSSLEIPPDLTKPSSQDAFKLSKYVSGVQEDVINFSDKDKAAKRVTGISVAPANIDVKKSGNRRWLVVDKKPEEVWGLSKSFLKSLGFAIKKSNKKTGLIETDFLESHADIPDQSLGLIRSMLRRAIKARYALPSVDKYRLRVEPVVDDSNKSEVYLSLTSMQEVLTDKGTENENTIWQSRPKDQTLEDEMLYRLMAYLGSDHAAAREKIVAAQETQKTHVKLEKGIGGYAKLVFALNQYDTWSNVGWALDQLSIDVEDKDVQEGSYYIHIAKTEDKGILSRLFGDDAIKKSFQIVVKQVNTGVTEVHFNDLSEKNEQSTIDFSYEFLGNIAKQF